MFITRISRGRTIREYIFGVVLVPSLMCFVWMTVIGGTAIVETGISDQLYATLAVLLDPGVAFVVSIIVVLLLMTYLVTSADSAILIINTINGAGENEGQRRHHLLF